MEATVVEATVAAVMDVAAVTDKNLSGGPLIDPMMSVMDIFIN